MIQMSIVVAANVGVHFFWYCVLKKKETLLRYRPSLGSISRSFTLEANEESRQVKRRDEASQPANAPPRPQPTRLGTVNECPQYPDATNKKSVSPVLFLVAYKH